MKRLIGIALWAALLAAPAARAQAQPEVPYVSTPPAVVATILELAQVGAGDYLIDLGAGDGRIVIEAAKQRGARGVGVELQTGLVQTARAEAQKQGVAERTRFVAGDLFAFDLGDASVLTMYLLPQINVRLRPRLFAQLKPGTRVVSHDFGMDDWQPDQQREVAVPGKSYGPPRSMVYLWVMPANVAGTWRWQLPVGGGMTGYEVTIAQRFQRLEVSGRVGGAPATVSDVRLNGAEIGFTLTREFFGQPVTHVFSGRVNGDALVGSVKVSIGEDERLEWEATRAERGTMRID